MVIIMKNTNKLSIGKAVFVTIFLYISISIAQADKNKHKQCSVATLNGSFGYTVTGALISGSFAGPFAATGKLTFDGAGNFKNSRTISRNGNILPSVEGSGTYAVYPDCMGTLTFTDGGVVTLGTDIVIDDNGNEIRMVATSPGTVLTIVGRKQFTQSGK